MTFNTFITKIFNCFNMVLSHVKNYLNILTENNYIKLSLMFSLFMFIIAMMFAIIGILPKILKIREYEEDKELRDFEKDIRLKRMRLIKDKQRLDKNYKPKAVMIDFDYNWLEDDD